MLVTSQLRNQSRRGKFNVAVHISAEGSFMIDQKDPTLSEGDRAEVWRILVEMRLPRLKWSGFGMISSFLFVWLNLAGNLPYNVSRFLYIAATFLMLGCGLVFAQIMPQLFVGYFAFRKGWSKPPESFTKAWRKSIADHADKDPEQAKQRD